MCNSLKLLVPMGKFKDSKDILPKGLGKHVGDINMHLQQKAYFQKCSLLCSCDENPWEIPVKDFCFTRFAGVQPATL